MLEARDYTSPKGKMRHKTFIAYTNITFVEAHREGEGPSKKLAFFAGK
jgi:hypothetical protein